MHRKKDSGRCPETRQGQAPLDRLYRTAFCFTPFVVVHTKSEKSDAIGRKKQEKKDGKKNIEQKKKTKKRIEKVKIKRRKKKRKGEKERKKKKKKRKKRVEERKRKREKWWKKEKRKRKECGIGGVEVCVKVAGKGGSPEASGDGGGRLG